MSVAEKLKAQGWAEGMERGLWIGKIQTLEEFLEKPPNALERLNAMPSAELEALESLLHRECAVRFKRGCGALRLRDSTPGPAFSRIATRMPVSFRCLNGTRRMHARLVFTWPAFEKAAASR